MSSMRNKCWELTDENKIVFDRDFGYEILNDGDNGTNYNEYQRASYIEDGEIIRVYSDRFELWSIPLYGGGEDMLCRKKTLNEIIDYFIEL